MSLKEKTKGITCNLMICVLAVCMGTQFQFYNNVVGSNLNNIFQKWFNESYTLHFGQPLNADQFSWANSIVTSCLQFGALLTAPLMKIGAEKLGRRKILIITGLVEALGAVIAGLSKLANSFEMMGVGRFIIGLGFGMGSGVAAMMISELAPNPDVRGAIGTIQQIVIGLGITLSFTFTLPQVLGTNDLWPIAVALPALPALLQVVIMIWAHDPPKYLLWTLGNREKSQLSLAFYKGPESVQQSFADLERDGEQQMRNNVKINFMQVLRKPIYRKFCFLSFMLMFAVQFTGASPVFAYSKKIFSDAGLDEMHAELCTIGLGIMNLVIPFIVMMVIDRFGRRLLMLSGLAISFITLLITTLLIKYNQPLVAIPFVYIYQIGFSVGSSVAWVMSAELFPQNIRGYGVTVCMCSYWLSQLITLLCYLPFKDAVGITYSFVPFLVITVATFTFFYFALPETKGKSPEAVILEYAMKGRGKGGQSATVTPIVRSLSVPSFHMGDDDFEKGSRF